MLEIGSKFGDYIVKERLGKGAMGEVYRISDGMTDYALKIMAAWHIADEAKRHEWRKRFAREAEVAMKVRHNNLVEVYDVGEDPQTHLCYILMEYVGGGTLTDRLKAKGRLEIREAVSITMHIANALSAAHAIGAVHRDIKPDNIMFTTDGVPKLADLGIACWQGSDDETTVTKTEMIVGTPAYMSPEQMLDSHNVDARADIYSLGVVFYEMLAGLRPNQGSTIVELMAKAINGEELPDVRELRPEVTAALAYALSRMVAQKAENRPASAAEAARLVYDAASGKIMVKNPPPGPKTRGTENEARGTAQEGKWKSAVKWIAACAVVAAVSLAVVFFMARRPSMTEHYREVVVTNVVNTVREHRVEDPPVDAAAPADELLVVKKFVDASLPEGVKSAIANSYVWRYKLENDDAILCTGGKSQCLAPEPKGKVVVPRELDGHKVVALDHKAFAGCDQMTEIVLPEGLKEFRGRSTFYRCNGLKEVVLPRSLENVWEWSFDECEGLKKVDVGRLAVYRAHGSLGCQFIGCFNIEEFAVDKDNPGYTAVDGAIYTKDLTELAAYPKARETITLPKSVKTLGWCSMSGFRRKHVVVPEGVEEIKSWAFEKSQGVEIIEFPKSLRRLGGWQFKWNSALKKVVFHGDAPTLTDKCLFKGAAKGVVVYVRRGSKGWNGPGSADIPARWPAGDPDARPVRYMDDGANSSALSGEWRGGPTDAWFVEWNKALAEAKRTGKRIFALNTGSDWCGWCKRLKADVLDEPGFAEFAAQNLVLLYLDSPHRNPLCEEQQRHNRETVRKIGFGGGVPEAAILSPDGEKIDSIRGGGYSLDAYLGKLKAILADSGWRVRSGERAAANAAASVTGSAKTSVLFPRLDRNGKAWAYSFELCDGWKRPDFDDGNWKRAPGGFGHREHTPEVRSGRINTEWTTKTIYLRRHFNWKGGEVSRAVMDIMHDDDVQVYLNGNTLLKIDGANNHWQPLEIDAEHFESLLEFGDNVLAVMVQNTGGPQYFDAGLVVETGGEKTARPRRRPGIYTAVTAAGKWTLKVENDGTVMLGDGDKCALDPAPQGRLAIPAALDGMRIRALAPRCFAGCRELADLTIPEGVRAIHSDAFRNCSALEKISLPQSLEVVRGEAFHEIVGLKRLDLKNVRIIEDCAFRWTPALEEVKVSPDNPVYFVKDGVLYDRVRRAIVFCPRSRTRYDFPKGIEDVYGCAFQLGRIKSIVFPDTIKHVGHSAFNARHLERVEFKGTDAIIGGWAFGSNPLKKVVLPKNLKWLDDWSIFEGCSQLEEIAIPDSVTRLSDAIFAGCRSLKRVKMGKNIEFMGPRVFQNCTSLETITLPASLNHMRDRVFHNCKSLKSVYFEGDCPDVVEERQFEGTSPELVIYVKKGTKGWTGANGKLPAKWPVGDPDARQIRYR